MIRLVKRSVPGHCCVADKCNFFLHTDILKGIGSQNPEEDALRNSEYCVSLIGEYRYGWNMLNTSGKTYELMVFDKKSENPWTEIESFFSNNKDDSVSKFNELVKKYKKLAS